MSLQSENVIPGEHGKTFTVNIDTQEEFEGIKDEVLKLDGIRDVIFNSDTYPHEVTVHTHKLVLVKDVQIAIRDAGYHAMPKDLYPLNY